MDPDVVEIPPPIHQYPPRAKKHKKQSVVCDVIDIEDSDDNDDDLVVLGQISRKLNKGKALLAIHDGHGDKQVMPHMEKVGRVSGIQSFNRQTSVSHNLINVDGQGSDPSLDDGDYLHMFSAAPSKKKSGASQMFRRGQSPMNPKMKATDKPESETLRKLRSFKQFDTVTDISDHYYIKKKSSMKHNPKNWAKKIQEEWRILEKHLPDTIFVRVYESRMDLMRAVIVGAQGTPYHDGLFFFDVYFPPEYPDEPPQVHYHSGGLHLNPNLYENGYVCLSLLNTWDGDDNEMWAPHVSTMLQVLVSIQGLILNAKPYFNEPGFEDDSGSQDGEKKALRYNEDTFILSVRTMTYMIRSPPKNFKDLVMGHFYSRAHHILGSCKAYMEGVQVGCFVKDRVQNVNKGKGRCSSKFKAGLVGYVKTLVQEFEKIGVKDCEKFTSLPAPTHWK